MVRLFRSAPSCALRLINHTASSSWLSGRGPCPLCLAPHLLLPPPIFRSFFCPAVGLGWVPMPPPPLLPASLSFFPSLFLLFLLCPFFYHHQPEFAPAKKHPSASGYWPPGCCVAAGSQFLGLFGVGPWSLVLVRAHHARALFSPELFPFRILTLSPFYSFPGSVSPPSPSCFFYNNGRTMILTDRSSPNINNGKSRGQPARPSNHNRTPGYRAYEHPHRHLPTSKYPERDTLKCRHSEQKWYLCTNYNGYICTPGYVKWYSKY